MTVGQLRALLDEYDEAGEVCVGIGNAMLPIVDIEETVVTQANPHGALLLRLEAN